ncbi:hypothetical protein, partial [Staphylococcus aureus]|uniref:hypothetical protein n=1 Tax=Staphylococcus aureus TaxID=1280 RepID=UPI0020C0B01C
MSDREEMTKLETALDFMNDVVKQNDYMKQLLESFDERILDANETIKECNDLLQDVLHMTEYFDNNNPSEAEYAAIGRKIAELRTRRRDAKKALYVLQQNQRVLNGLAPAVVTANSKITEPSPLGNPT